MILSDNEVNVRLESPLNLINRIKSLSQPKTTGMELFVPNTFQYFTGDGSNLGRTVENPAAISDDNIKAILDSIKEDPKDLDDVMPDNAAKIKLGIVKSKALDVLHDSLQMLGQRLPEITKVRDYSTIARDMKNIIEDEDSNHKPINQVIVYKPITNEINKYETIIAAE